MVHRLNTASDDFEERFTAFLGTKREASEDVNAAVADIIADVRGARRSGPGRLHGPL